MLKKLTYWLKERRGYDIPEKIQPVKQNGKINVKNYWFETRREAVKAAEKYRREYSDRLANAVNETKREMNQKDRKMMVLFANTPRITYKITHSGRKIPRPPYNFHIKLKSENNNAGFKRPGVMSIIIRKDVQIKEHRYSNTEHYEGNHQIFYNTVQYTPIGIKTQLEQGENPFLPREFKYKFDEINKKVGKWISRQNTPLRAKEQHTVINPEYRDDMLGENLYHYHGEDFGKEYRPLTI